MASSDIPIWPWALGGVVGLGVAALATQRSAVANPLPKHYPQATPLSMTGTAPSAPVPPAPPPAALPPTPPSGTRETGSAILARTENMGQMARERVFLASLAQGNFPSWLLNRARVPVSGGGHTGTVWVMPDFLAVGTDEDFVRVPLTPTGAQMALDRLGMMLPTPRIVEAIYQAARALPPTVGGFLPFHSWSPRARVGRGSNTALREHHTRIEQDRAGRQGLVDGHQKYVVTDTVVATHPGRVVIKGGHHANGSEVQPQFPGHGSAPATGHGITYLDYSHGIRGVYRTVEIDGAMRDYVEVLADRSLAPILSATGPIPHPRYHPA